MLRLYRDTVVVLIQLGVWHPIGDNWFNPKIKNIGVKYRRGLAMLNPYDEWFDFKPD